MHGARTVHTVWGNYPAFNPQLDPHKTAAHSNIGTQKTSNHMSFLQSKVHLVWYGTVWYGMVWYGMVAL